MSDTETRFGHKTYKSEGLMEVHVFHIKDGEEVLAGVVKMRKDTWAADVINHGGYLAGLGPGQATSAVIMKGLSE